MPDGTTAHSWGPRVSPVEAWLAGVTGRIQKPCSRHSVIRVILSPGWGDMGGEGDMKSGAGPPLLGLGFQ